MSLIDNDFKVNNIEEAPVDRSEKTADEQDRHGNTRRELVDMFARSITYLRVSVTDHCNLRCIYCTPQGEHAKLVHTELLTYEELLRIVSLAVKLGIKKVRVTGGEPLVRRNILPFIEKLALLPGLDDIRLTTNGVLLSEYAEGLFRAGIRKLNISLDTLQRKKFKQITGADRFEQVWRGIELAERLGFQPIKINVVVMRGINDDELLDFARLTLSRPYQIRFIEFMPVGKSSVWGREKYMSMTEMKACLTKLGELLPLQSAKADGPAQIFRFNEGEGTLGFISPISNHFCDRCNRLRLTAEGRLRSCLLHDHEVDLKTIIRSGCDDEAINRALIETVLQKPKGHRLDKDNPLACHGRMSRIGG